MKYKVIVFNNAEEIEKALEAAYDEGYNAGFDDCFEEAEDDTFKEIETVREELRKKHEAELDKVGHEAYEEGKKVGHEDGYQKGFEAAKQLYGGLTYTGGTDSAITTHAEDGRRPPRQIAGITWTDNGGSEQRCVDAVSHINI